MRIGLIRSGIIALVIVPVAPASRSAIKVTPSSPSNGPAMASPAAALDGDARAEMAACDNHRNPAGHVRQAELEQRLALGIGQKELLGKVRQDADAVDALIDHAVEHAAHAVEVEVTVVMKRYRRSREDAHIGLG